jgi:hypothetical protein
MTDPLIVTIPATPPRSLSPNGRVHWRRKHADGKELQSAARWATVNAIHTAPLGPRLITGPVTLHWLVAWERGRKKMDQDNLIAALKAAQDGIAGALGIDDKVMVVGSVTQERDTDGFGFIRCAIEETPHA